MTDWTYPLMRASVQRLYNHESRITELEARRTTMYEPENPIRRILWKTYRLSIVDAVVHRESRSSLRKIILAHDIVVCWLEAHPKDAADFHTYERYGGKSGIGYFGILRKVEA